MPYAQTSPVEQSSDQTSPPRFLGLARITVLAAFGSSLAFLIHTLLVLVIGQTFVPPLLILGLVMLISAPVALLRLRFAPVITALVVLVANGASMSVPIDQYDVTHPGEGLFFIINLLALAFALVSIVAAIGAVSRKNRHLEPPEARKVNLSLSIFTAFVVGMIIVSLLATANPPTSTASTTTNGMPTVHMSPTVFAQDVVLVPKGSKLLLVDDGNYNHILSNGSWQNSTPDPQKEPGAPAVQNVSLNGGSLVIGPFTTAGIYHIYCTVHVGMNLTIVVQ
jgi:plastocyanin